MRRVQMKERVGSSQMPKCGAALLLFKHSSYFSSGSCRTPQLQVRSSYLHELEMKRVKYKVYLTYYSTYGVLKISLSSQSKLSSFISCVNNVVLTPHCSEVRLFELHLSNTYPLFL